MKLYIDEDAMGAGLASGLRARGVDVLTAEEAQMRGQSDERHLEYALAQDRVLYSYNRRDFARIHRDWTAIGRRHGGIVLLTNRRAGYGYQIEGLLRLLSLPAAALTSSLHYI